MIQIFFKKYAVRLGQSCFFCSADAERYKIGSFFYGVSKRNLVKSVSSQDRSKQITGAMMGFAGDISIAGSASAILPDVV